MPNWITNELTIETNEVSKDIKEELKFYVSKDDDGKEGLDFDRVIRMPPSLQITAGGSVEEAMAVIKGDLKFFSERLKWWKGKGSWLEKEGIKTAKALMEHSRKRLSEKELGEGKKAIENLRKYGHKDWYDWCCANWGTKWNASDTHWNGNSVSFLTAWAPPDPVIQKMADETGHVIQNMWFDEGDVEDVQYTTFSPNNGDN